MLLAVEDTSQSHKTLSVTSPAPATSTAGLIPVHSSGSSDRGVPVRLRAHPTLTVSPGFPTGSIPGFPWHRLSLPIPQSHLLMAQQHRNIPSWCFQGGTPNKGSPELLNLPSPRAEGPSLPDEPSVPAVSVGTQPGSCIS